MQKHVRQWIGYLFLSLLFLLIISIFWHMSWDSNTMGSSCSSTLWQKRGTVENLYFQWFLEDGYPCRYTNVLFNFYIYFIPFYYLYKYLESKIWRKSTSFLWDIGEVTALLLIHWGVLLSVIDTHILPLSGEVIYNAFAGSLVAVFPVYVLALLRRLAIKLGADSFLKGVMAFILGVIVFIIWTFTAGYFLMKL